MFGTEYAEKDALKILLSESDVFQRYYDEFRPQVPYNLRWVTGTTLEPGVRAAVSRQLENRLAFIEHSPPLTKSDARLIAHEIHHLILDLRGFPFVGSVANDKFHTVINSILQDPIVERQLLELGFDVMHDYLLKVEVSKSQIGAFETLPSGITRTRWIFNCAYHYFCWEAISPNHQQQSPILDWLFERFPDIVKPANRFIKLLDKIQFDTPDKMYSAMRIITQDFKLGHLVCRPVTLVSK